MYDRTTADIIVVSLIDVLYNKDVFDASVSDLIQGTGLCYSSMRVDCTIHCRILRHDNKIKPL